VKGEKMSVKIYRKKPVVIEAIQLNEENTQEVLNFCGRGAAESAGGRILIATLESKQIASIGDYIIKGVAGEFYPCKPEIFLQTYDAV
jgi:hypothetical protein